MEHLSEQVSHWLDCMFGGWLPTDQPSATAFAGALTLSLARSAARCPVLYCSPKTAQTKRLLSRHNIPFTPREQVAAGEEIVITHCGAPIARLSPINRMTSKDIRTVIEEMREFRKNHKLAGLNIREMIEAGRQS